LDPPRTATLMSLFAVKTDLVKIKSSWKLIKEKIEKGLCGLSALPG